jgi:hypothetical protein
MKRLTKSDLQTNYKSIEPQLKRYCDKFPEYDIHEMLKEVLTDKAVMWVGDKSFVIGGPCDYHNQRTFLLESAAGDLEEIVDGLGTIEEEVVAWGFNTLEICGRLGWTKKMKPYGFNANRIILKKAIGDKDGR